MRALPIAAAVALLTLPAYAQGSRGGPGVVEREQSNQQRARKADEAEKAYKSGLDKIPNADKKPDPWGDLRGAGTTKSK
jgi:hypothetical protein